MKIGCAINSWDEPEGVYRILQQPHVYEYFDYFIIIEGAYLGRIDKPVNPLGLMDDLGKLDKVIYCRMEDKKQIEKRNMYWGIAEGLRLDYLIICDTDEYIELEPAKFTEFLHSIWDYPAHCFPIQTLNINEQWNMARPRLFKNIEGIRHKQSKGPQHISHGSLFEHYGKGPEVICQMYKYYMEINGQKRTSEGIKMYHNKKDRSIERSITDEAYYSQTPDR